MGIVFTYIVGTAIVLLLAAINAFKGTTPDDRSLGVFLLALFVAQLVLLCVVVLIMRKRNKEYEKVRELHGIRSRSEAYTKSIYAAWTVIAVLQVPALASFFMAFAAPYVWHESTSRAWLIVGIVLEAVSALFLLIIRSSKVKKAEEDKHPAKSDADLFYAEALYENPGYTYDTACENYCKQYGKDPKSLTAEDQKQIEQYMYDDFAYLLMWIIENDFYCTKPEWDLPMTNSMAEFAAKIRNRECLPTEYLAADGIFTEEEIKRKARGFVKKYYEGAYESDLGTYVKDSLGSELYGFPFRWEDYDAFKPVINAAYEQYVGNGKKD